MVYLKNIYILNNDISWVLINPAFNLFPVDFMKLSPTAKSSNIWRLPRGPELVHFWIDSSAVNEIIHYSVESP